MNQKAEKINAVSDIAKAREFEDIPLLQKPGRTRAFLKIEDGCENFCSYCIIPYARGRVRSRSLASIKRETEKLLAAGFKEIVFTGIHLGAYGRDLEGVTLADACRAALSFPALKRLRLGSLEAAELSDDLFELFDDKRLVPHFHLPLQAGSDTILAAMRRPYRTAEFTRLVERVISRLPDAAISTDVIVGFPGETAALFDEGAAYIEKMPFMRLHIFPFSAREGTAAYSMPDQVSPAAKKERVHLLKALGEKKSRDFCRKFIGRTVRVLFETERDGITDGLTDNYFRVYTEDRVESGEFYDVELRELYLDGILGKVLER